LKLLQYLLSKQGVKSDSAINGADAVEACAAKDFGYYDVIFMDYTMPVMVKRRTCSTDYYVNICV
jgi:CheY-like chemotaxis protein